MKRLKDFLIELKDEGAVYLSEVIHHFEIECNYKYFVLDEELEFEKWNEISEIIALDGEVNKVNIISDILDLLSRIEEYYKENPNEEDYRNDCTKEMNLEFYKRKSNCYFLAEILKDYGA